MINGYSIYGLRLQANRPIPGLVACPKATPVDVQIWLGSAPPWVDARSAKQPAYISPYHNKQGTPILTVWKLNHLTEHYFWLCYSDGTKFVINGSGNRIWATWLPATSLEDTATYLLGPILGFVLRLRGITCLHASAVAIDGRAVILVGPAGAGKSTTAAALARLGYPILSDDIVALSEQKGAFLVQPAYPRLRLWPESAQILYGSKEALPSLTPTWNKCYLDLTADGYYFQNYPLALAAIYILRERTNDPQSPFIEGVWAHAGLIHLIGNTYVNYLLDKPQRAQEFEFLGRLAANVPVRQIYPHADPACLSELCQVIRDDFRKVASTIQFQVIDKE
ncbi:MAG TPA: serine/threonine protein kinase [Anaerolineae bacterium]|nr:serine/threonine protein kinase [Anaerolineae bacterium]